MYTLVIVFWFVSGGQGVSVSTSTVPGFASEAECNQWGQKSVSDLKPKSRDINYRNYEVNISCVKTK
jgi:hypothetical protein